MILRQGEAIEKLKRRQKDAQQRPHKGEILGQKDTGRKNSLGLFSNLTNNISLRLIAQKGTQRERQPQLLRHEEKAQTLFFPTMRRTRDYEKRGFVKKALQKGLHAKGNGYFCSDD